MNNKVPLFSKVCFLAVVPFLILTTLFSCNNVITDNPKNTPSVKPEKDKVVTITGFIRNPYEEAETGSRAALPTSSFNDKRYIVTATAPGVSGEVSGTVNASVFSIPLSLGKEWTINVEMEKKEEGDDEYKLVMTASGGFGHALTEADVTTPLTLVLEPLISPEGEGKINLSFSAETDGLYDDVSIEIDDAAKRAVWNAAVTLHKDTGKISASSIKSGVYCVTINFYKDNVLVYSTTQSINVFDNMTTNRWVSSSTQNSPITTAGAFVLTEDIIDHFRLTNYFIASTTSAIAGNDSNSGSPYAPLASIGEALRRISVTGNEDAFTIRLMSDITENVTIPGTGTGGLNDKALSVTIKPLSGSVTVSGVAGAGKSVFNIATEIPVTLENLTITGGSATGNGGGLNIGTDAEVTLRNCSVRENSVTGSSSLGGGIYNGGQLYVEGRINVTENTKGSGTGAVASNVYLPYGKKIGIIGALNDTSTIGVTVCTESATSYPIVFTSGLGAHSSLANLSENSACEVFTSDEGYVFRVRTGMNGLEMVLLASEGGITNVFDDVVELSCDDAYVVPGSIITVAATVNDAPVPAKDTSWSFEITLSGEHIATLQGTSLIGYGSVKIPSNTVIFDDAKYMLHATVKVNGVGYDDCFMLLGKSDSLSAQGFVAVTGATVSGAIGLGNTASNVFIAGRTVTIPNLLVCDHEVTQAEYAAVMGENPSLLDGSSQLQPAENEKQKNRPVERVSWFKAIAYCNKRSSADGLTPCYTINGSTNPDDWGSVVNSIDSLNAAVGCDFNADGYRLPTEAEWEYIARGGNGLAGTQYIYSGNDTASAVAWSSTDNRSDGMSHEVKIKLPNSLEIYDMSGNVWEWCWDRAVPGANDIPADITTDTPYTGSTTGDYRVCRGGSYYRPDDRCALTYRDSGGPLSSNYRAGGFRVVRTNKIPEQLAEGTTGTAGTGATYMYFGEWPQTIIASGVTVNENISKENGLFTYYYGSDGAWYVNQAENAYETGYTYSNGTSVAQGGTSYKYFKVEPIKWRVLTTNYNGTGKKLLLSENILANMIFYNSTQEHGNSLGVGVSVHANNYEHSRIRAYLNGINYDINSNCADFYGNGFLQTAFTSSAQSQIANTTVMEGDNAIMNNKVFLLSTEEAGESAYGLNEAASRIRDTTDFAKASGTYIQWWVRSSGSNNGQAQYIDTDGGTGRQQTVHNTGVGVVPAICIE